jgi:hypothetical protein
MDIFDDPALKDRAKLIMPLRGKEYVFTSLSI